MELRHQILVLIDTFASANGVAGATVTDRAMGGGGVYRALREDGNVTLKRIESGIEWLSANWPSTIPWPEGIARPAVADPDEPDPSPGRVAAA